LLGYYLLRPPKTLEAPIAERRQHGFLGVYYKFGRLMIAHRWRFMAGSVVFLALGAFAMSKLHTAFFPKDLSYLSYVDVWLPEDAPVAATDATTRQAEAVLQQAAAEFGKEHPGPDGKPREVLEFLTSFVGGGGPRFWYSLAPEPRQNNYAQIMIQVKDKHDTSHLVVPLQQFGKPGGPAPDQPGPGQSGGGLQYGCGRGLGRGHERLPGWDSPGRRQADSHQGAAGHG
jgi:multidrug efflux pump subunit AcrB